MWKGVRLYLSRTLGSAPFSNSFLTTASCPLSATCAKKKRGGGERMKDLTDWTVPQNIIGLDLQGHQSSGEEKANNSHFSRRASLSRSIPICPTVAIYEHTFWIMPSKSISYCSHFSAHDTSYIYCSTAIIQRISFELPFLILIRVFMTVLINTYWRCSCWSFTIPFLIFLLPVSLTET